MFTIKTIAIGVMLGVAVAIPLVLVLGGQLASPSPTPATTAPVPAEPNETITPQENNPLTTENLAKLAKAGINVETLVILQECRNGWEAQASQVQNALAGQPSQNLK